MARVAPPLTEQQAARIRPLGLLADAPSGLCEAWRRVEDMWETTVARAGRLPSDLLDERVNGEWSFLETLRHLIMVTDTWVGKMVLARPAPYDPIGLPPDFVTNGAELGLDLDAHPSLTEVLASRASRMAEVRGVLSHLSSEDLNRVCTTLGSQFTVLGALQNVIFEEWAHHEYATRDLAALDDT